MYLEIPIKLESYVNEIKKQVKNIEKESKLTLLQIGKSNYNDKYKLMYILYNPFPVVLDINPNFFSNQKVYKMYPSEFKLYPETAYAFVVFLEQEMILEINEKNLTNIYKQQINSRIMRLEKINYEGKYKESLIYNLDEIKVDVEKTINLNSNEKINNIIQEDNFIEFKQTMINDLDFVLDDLNFEENEVIFTIELINKGNKNIEFFHAKIKISDDKRKYFVDINENIKLKANTKKNIKIAIDKKELILNFEKIKVKVNIF